MNAKPLILGGVCSVAVVFAGLSAWRSLGGGNVSTLAPDRALPRAPSPAVESFLKNAVFDTTPAPEHAHGMAQVVAQSVLDQGSRLALPGSVGTLSDLVGTHFEAMWSQDGRAWVQSLTKLGVLFKDPQSPELIDSYRSMAQEDMTKPVGLGQVELRVIYLNGRRVAPDEVIVEGFARTESAFGAESMPIPLDPAGQRLTIVEVRMPMKAGQVGTAELAPTLTGFRYAYVPIQQRWILWSAIRLHAEGTHSVFTPPL